MTVISINIDPQLLGLIENYRTTHDTTGMAYVSIGRSEFIDRCIRQQLENVDMTSEDRSLLRLINLEKEIGVADRIQRTMSKLVKHGDYASVFLDDMSNNPNISTRTKDIYRKAIGVRIEKAKGLLMEFEKIMDSWGKVKGVMVTEKERLSMLHDLELTI